MTDEGDKYRHWTLDKRVPLALIVTLALQTGGFIWWAAKADNRLDTLEKAAATTPSPSERIIRVETKLESVLESISELKTIVRNANR